MSERQRTPTNVSEGQRTSANVSEGQRRSANVSERQRTSANVSERQRNVSETSAKRQRTSANVSAHTHCRSLTFVDVRSISVVDGYNSTGQTALLGVPKTGALQEIHHLYSAREALNTFSQILISSGMAGDQPGQSG